MIDTDGNGPVVWSRVAFGVLCVLGYFVLMILAAFAMQHKCVPAQAKKDVENFTIARKSSAESVKTLVESGKTNAPPAVPILPVQIEARAAFFSMRA